MRRIVCDDTVQGWASRAIPWCDVRYSRQCSLQSPFWVSHNYGKCAHSKSPTLRAQRSSPSHYCPNSFPCATCSERFSPTWDASYWYAQPWLEWNVRRQAILCDPPNCFVKRCLNPHYRWMFPYMKAVPLFIMQIHIRRGTVYARTNSLLYPTASIWIHSYPLWSSDVGCRYEIYVPKGSL